MALFRKKSDPLTEEIERIQAEQKRLAREVARTQAMLDHPEPAVEEDFPDEPAGVKGAVFADFPSVEKEPVVVRKRLKKQRQIARNRFILICVVLALLALVIYRSLHS